MAPDGSRLGELRVRAREVEVRWITRSVLRVAASSTDGAESALALEVLDVHSSDPDSPVLHAARILKAEISAA
jgi:hypothetical protein